MDEIRQAYQDALVQIDENFGNISAEAGTPHQLKMGALVQTGSQMLTNLAETASSPEEINECAKAIIEGITAHNEAAGMKVTANSPGMQNQMMMNRAIELENVRGETEANIGSQCVGPSAPKL